MRAVYRNIVKGYPLGQLLAIAKNNARKYNETWFVLGNSGMAANAKGHKGYEQYPALACHPDGSVENIPAAPRQEEGNA